MTQTFFITGTDTDVGKTVCCAALLQAANQQGLKTLAYKPIAAGCEKTSAGLRNDDALTLQQYSNIEADYDLINPIAFEQPIAPHIAAELENRSISIDNITLGLEKLQSYHPDVLFVEGAGGWSLPLNNKQLLSDWVEAQQLSVIIVVGMKLGCLNHALLTYQTIKSAGLKVAGWIANQTQTEMPYYAQNLALLNAKIDAPLLAEIPHLPQAEHHNLGQYVDLKSLKI
ncbi:dethiobiotin synthase [Psychromonas sp. psych-6C06]|uniref:dethiobiotin synthase n=1 Tax=Psychromonas sp. psych-6C06 TaxID=2058089 RepID=UPI000C34F0FD|nr:dethiobiotin synthase [Psychromonas sp. psych-6C06]PKF63854.1 dethiobiotin synthase [Psychromonas sp. psych-6C06]